MKTIKAWFVPVDGEAQEISVPKSDNILSYVKDHYIKAFCDMPKVRYNGKVCHMAVDDEGMLKDLPINKIATEAYWKACRPGTTHPVVGPAVIFDGLLP
jgi:hypothetical protein